MRRAELIKVYKTTILPAVEYCSVVYNSLISKQTSEELEAVQKLAISIIYGNRNKYHSLIESGEMETLKERRDKDSLKFANKALKNPRFGDRWFRRNETERTARQETRKPYREAKCKTERMRANPVQYMTRQLNEQEMSGK